MKRRKFMIAGLGTTGLSVLGLKQFFGSSPPNIKPIEYLPGTERVAPAAHDVTKRYSSQKKSSHENKIFTLSNTEEEKEVEIFLKYGGEFSCVKPRLKPGR